MSAPLSGQVHHARPVLFSGSPLEVELLNFLSGRTSESTERTYRSLLKRLLPQLPVERSHDILPAHLAQLQTLCLRTSQKPRSQALAVSACRSFLLWLLDLHDGQLQYTERQVAKLLQPPKAQTAEPHHALTDEEIERLRRACQDPRHRLFLELSLIAGLRLIETCRLRRCDVHATIGSDGKEGLVLHVSRGKRNRARSVVIPIQLRPAIEAFCGASLSRLVHDSRPLFVAMDKGAHKRKQRPITTNTARNWLRTICAAAGLEAVLQWYDMRATFVLRMLLHDRDPRRVQRQMGHRRPETIENYLNQIEQTDQGPSKGQMALLPPELAPSQTLRSLPGQPIAPEPQRGRRRAVSPDQLQLQL